MVKSTKCFFGIHDWVMLKKDHPTFSNRRQCTRCKKRQVYIKFSRHSGKWLHN